MNKKTVLSALKTARGIIRELQEGLDDSYLFYALNMIGVAIDEVKREEETNDQNSKTNAKRKMPSVPYGETARSIRV